MVGHLNKFHPQLTLRRFTKATFFEYLAYLHEQGMADGTIGQHVKFLRIRFRVAEQHIPAWLVFKVKIGRAASLRQELLLALARYDATAQPHLLFQTTLLLRDSDLCQLKFTPRQRADPHRPAPGQLVLEFCQTKTGDEVRLPLPAAGRRHLAAVAGLGTPDFAAEAQLPTSRSWLRRPA
ncbi:MAG: hypothetical protein EOO63_01175 [Hymenobacter sp.]|nr:MAG: hypothetical protein EOO63_01175 [Hymenobacter sp.]